MTHNCLLVSHFFLLLSTDLHKVITINACNYKYSDETYLFVSMRERHRRASE